MSGVTDMDDGIVYRAAALEDCYEVAVLKGLVWNTTYKGIYSDAALTNYDVDKNRKIFESIVQNPDIELYIAQDGNRIVGLMTCGKPFRPFGDYQQEIGLLYILASHQRRGIGRNFLDMARKHAAVAHCNELMVSVNRQNANAIRFYLAMGGRIIFTDDKQMKLAYSI